MKRSLCIDARMYGASGIGTYLRNLLKFLTQDARFRVKLIVDASSCETFNNYDVVPASSKIYSVKEQFELPAKIPSCDLFWSPHYNIPVFPIRSKKRVVTIHDVFHLAYKKNLKMHQRLYAELILRQAVNRSDLIVTDSFFSKEEIIRFTGVEEGKVRVSYLGVDEEAFAGAPLSKIQRCKEKYKLDAPFILYVGNIKPHKNLPLLMKALKGWLKIKGPIDLVVIGRSFSDYPYKEIVSEDHELKRHVRFLEGVGQEELPCFYALTSALVHPSFYEGFGLTPLEAMSAGCPAIVSRAASLPEVCGDAAVYFDPFCENSLFSALEKVLEDKSFAEDLKRRGKERVVSFRWEKTAEMHFQFFEELLE